MNGYLNNHVGEIKVVVGKQDLFDWGMVKLAFILVRGEDEFFISPTRELIKREANLIYDTRDDEIPWLDMSQNIASEVIKVLQERGIKASDKEAYEVRAELLTQQLKLKDDLIAVQEKRIDDLKDEIKHYNRKEKK